MADLAALAADPGVQIALEVHRHCPDLGMGTPVLVEDTSQVEGSHMA